MSTAPYTPTTYDIFLFRDGFAVVEVYAQGFGRSVVERGFDCEAAAEHHIEELLAAEAEEAAEIAEAAAEYANDTVGDLAQSAADLLYAFDRGDFGNAHLFSDGSESAYFTALRAKVAAYRRAA